MERVSKKGRTFINGRALDKDLRTLIIDDIISRGGCSETGYFPGEMKCVADKNKISNSTVKKLWVAFCEDKTVDARPHKGGNPSKLSPEDLEFIEVLLTANPSLSQKELQNELAEYGDIFGGTSRSALSRALHSRMLSGKEYTHKKVSTVAIERFTDINMIYTQMFINYLHLKDPFKMKFFGEAGLKLPNDSNRCSGYAPKGERCVEVRRYHETPNITVNVLAGLEGVKYANIVDGASATIHFLNFWGEAANTGDIITGRPTLEVGDIVIMDNCATHHYDGGTMLERFLEEIGVELIYTPAYSPDFNPVEFVFSKMRTEMHYRQIGRAHV